MEFYPPVKRTGAYYIRLKKPYSIHLQHSTLESARTNADGIMEVRYSIRGDDLIVVSDADKKILEAAIKETKVWFKDNDLNAEEIASLQELTLSTKHKNKNPVADDDDADEKRSESSDNEDNEEDKEEITDNKTLTFQINLDTIQPPTLLMFAREHDFIDVDQVHVPKGVHVSLALIALQFFKDHFKPIWTVESMNVTPLQLEQEDEFVAEPLPQDRQNMCDQLHASIMQREQENLDEIEHLRAAIVALEDHTKNMYSELEELKQLLKGDLQAWLTQHQLILSLF